MPQILETDIGEFELPDEFTPEQIRDFATTKLPRFRKRIALEDEREKFEREKARQTISKTITGLGLGVGTEGPPEVRRGFYGLGETAARMFEETEKVAPAPDIVSLFTKGVKALTRRISGEKVKSLADAPAQLRAQATKEAEQARELGAAIGGGRARELAQQFGTTATVSAAAFAPALVAAPVVGPMGALGISAATAGLQGGGSSYASVKDKLLREGVSEREAEELARHFGAVSGLITAAVTRLYGLTGMEAFAKGATAGTFRKKVLAVLKDARFEGEEELVDELLQQLWEKASASPEKPWAELVHDTALAGAFGYGLGAGVGGGREAIGGTAQRVSGEADLLAERFREPNLTRADLTARVLAAPEFSGRPQEAPEAIAEGFIRLQREREAAEQAAQPAATQAPAYPYQGPVQPDRLPLAPVQPADVPDPVNASDLVTIARNVAERFAANPQGLPQRAQVRLPIMQRLLARLQEAPGDPDILSDLAGTLDLQFDPTTQTFPRRYQTVEGGRLTRRRRPPQPADIVPRRTKPTTEVPSAQQVSQTIAPDGGVRPSERPPVGQAPGSQVPPAEGGPRVPEGGQGQEVPAPPSAQGAVEPATPAIIGEFGAGVVGGLYDSMFRRLMSGGYPEPFRTEIGDRIASEHKRQPFTSSDDLATWVKTQQRPPPAPPSVQGAVTLPPELAGFPFKPVRWEGNLPVFSGAEARRELARRFGAPNGLGRYDPKFLGQRSPFGAQMAVFVDDAQDGKPIAIFDSAIDVSATSPSAPSPIAPAEFIGWQQIPGRPSLPMFRLTADLNERQKAGSTVMGPTLEAAGFSLPEYAPEETTPAPPATPPNVPPPPPPPTPTPPATQDIPFEPPPQPPPEPAPDVVAEPERKLAEEEAEVELVKQARQIVRSAQTPLAAYRSLVELYQQAPRLGTRTAVSKASQAYSTPPPLAYLVDLLANLSTGTRIVEPTVGHGMLLIGAPEQSFIFANELDPNRTQRFTSTFPSAYTTSYDATSSVFFDSFSEVRPDRIVMNPPFGSRPGQRFKIINAVTAKEDTGSIDLAIALNTLETMVPEGKAVLILGAKTGTMGPQFSPDPAQRAKDYSRGEFLELFKRFNVVDWFTVDGKLYERMGAGWPVDIVVIDGKKPTLPSAEGGFVRPWIQPPPVFDSWQALEGKVNEAQSISGKAPSLPPSPGGRRPLPERGPRGGGGRGGRQGGTGVQPPSPGDSPTVSPPSGLPRPGQPGGQTGGPGVLPEPGPTPPGGSGAGGRPSGGTGQVGERPGAVAGGAPSITDNLSQEDQARLAELERRLREKLRQISVGIDPETALIGAEMTGLYVKAGVKTFADYARRFKAQMPDLWERIKRYLHGFWGGVAADFPDIEEITRAQAQQIIEQIDRESASTPPPSPPSAPQLEDETINVKYSPVSRNADPKLMVPRNVADAMRRAVIALEKETGKPVDDYVASKMGWSKTELYSRLSAAQIEPVGLFIRNLENRRSGLINSSQTGVGKGRSVAAVIEYARRIGKIPIFVTASKTLYTDMAGRDLPAVGNSRFNPFITDSEVQYVAGSGEDITDKPGSAAQRETMLEIASSGKLPAGFHGIFTTFYQLRSDKPVGFSETPKERARRKKKFEARPDGPRMAMLRKLAPNAIFILDEAHEAAGEDSDVGLALQSILPKANGVYYSSATFAKRPDNLTLYALGTALKLSGLSRNELANLFKSGGIPMQQALTSMLAEDGEFVRMEQDMSDVRYRFESIGMNPDREVELADTYTGFIRDLFPLAAQVNGAIEGLVDGENGVRPEGAEVSVSKMTFGSRLFNLSNQYLFSLRSGAAINKAVGALKNGQKPFIAVYNTMAGPIADLGNRNLPLTFSGLLEREMQKLLEITINDPMAPDDPVAGTKRGKREITLKPEDLPDGGAYFYRLQGQIQATDFAGMPISPIDAIKKGVQAAGFSIGEITARDGEVDESGSEVTVSRRERQERNKILSDYNNGALDALIVNGSSSTGVSAHTDPKFRDQRQRHMIVAQPAPDINGFMQILGRVMRFGQTKLPVYTILTSSLAAEQRFMTMLRGKLASLNANTSADTESGLTQAGIGEDIFNFIGDEVVFDVMSANPDLAQLAMISLPEDRTELDNFARKATGYFVLLSNADAQMLWGEIIESYQARIQALDEAGDNPLKASVLDLRAKTISKKEIRSGTGKTRFDGPVVLEETEVKPTKPPLTLQEAKQMAENGRGAAEQQIVEWLRGFDQAIRLRLQTMRERETPGDRIQATEDAMQRVRQAVDTARGLVGEVVGIRSDESDEFEMFGVPVGIRLRSQSMGDFTGASKHTLIIATNSLRRSVSIPLSQLDRLVVQGEEQFDSTRQASGRRYVVTGNLIRGLSDALKMAARGVGRPKVTIYSTDQNEVRTGVLMPVGFDPDSASRLSQAVATIEEFNRHFERGTLISAGPMLIRGPQVSVPSRNEFRNIWGDPDFSRMFVSAPVQTSGEFRGELRQGAVGRLWDFISKLGLRPNVEPTNPSGALPLEIEPGPEQAPDTRYNDVLENQLTVEQILDAIIERSGVPFYRDLAERFKRLGVNPRVITLPRQELEKLNPGKISAATQGFYDPTTHIIVLLKDAGDIEWTFLHEMVHAATLKELQNPNSPITKEITALFEEASKNPGLMGQYYGMTNVLEFVTEAYTNLGFRTALDRIGAPVSIWRRLFNAIRRLLGLSVEQESMLERLMRVSAPAFSGERPTGGGPILESRLEAFESVDALEEFLRQPTIEPEVEAQMRTAAGAQAGLVSDAILNRILAIDNTNAIGRRQRSLLDFVLKLRNLAPVQQIKAILASNLKPDVKDAAVSAVLRQIEHVKAKTEEYGLGLEKAMGRLENLQKSMERYDGTALTQNIAAESARSLLNDYRGYLSSRAAQLPADANLAAGRRDALDRMGRVITGWEKTPAAIEAAIQAIARNIDALPLTSGVQAVLDAIRTRGILQGVGSEVVDLLTAPQPNGLPPLLSSREFLESLKDLQRVQIRAQSLAKEIQTFEAVFAGPKVPTPVTLRQWAERYRKWRNTQAEASAVLRQFNREYKQADEDFEVHSGAVKVLTDLQDDPLFRAAYDAALESDNVLYKDIAKADPITKETLYIGPVSKKEFRINLSPDKIADDQAVKNMQELLEEIDQFLAGPGVDPLLAQTWQFRRDYIRRWVFFPQFHKLIRPEYPVPGTSWRIPWSPFDFLRGLAGGHLRAARPELAWMGIRAAKDAEHWYELGDFVSNQFRQLRNSPEFGDAAISLAIIKALNSHHWDENRLKYWNTYVLNEIIASQQNVGQLRLKEGKWVNGIQITPEDMEVARIQKRYTNRALSITQKGAQKTPLQFYNPLQIEDKFANLNVTRNAIGPGPMTMARSLGEFGEVFALEWSAKKSVADKLAMIADGQNFHLTVMGHIRETNPERGSKSPHQRFYTELADLASRDPDYNFTSLDQLVDWLATRAVDSNLYPDLDTATEQVKTELVREIDGAAKAFLTILADSRTKAPTENPKAALEQASAQNSFTRPRVRLVAPSTWYDYTLSEDVKRTAYLASGYQIYQLNQLQALEALQLALERKRTEYEKAIDAMTARGTSRRRAITAVQKQSIAETQHQETRFNYKRLVEYINTLTIIRKHLSELVVDQRTPFDGAVIFSLSKAQGLLSSALLSQAQAIANNALGGAITTQFVFEQNVGRAALLMTPLKLGGGFAKTIVKRLLILAPAKSVVGKALRANIPGFTAMAQYLADRQVEMVEFYNRAFQAGIVNPEDTAGRSKAISELKTSGGRIEFADPPAFSKVTNWIESIPGIRRFLVELRDKSPRAVDDVTNLNGMNALQKNQFDNLKLEAISAFEARAQAKKSNDFSKEENLLEPGELGFRTSRGYRDLEATRRLFSSIGLLDSVLLDYYQRWKAAPVDQRPEIPFLADPGEELQLIFEVAALNNMPTAGYTPPFMQGVGYKGVIKGLAGMFMNHPMRLAQQADFLGSTDPRDPKWRREAAAGWAVISTLIVLIVIGMLAREPGQEVLEITTGRSTSQLRLANVIADPNWETLSRYTGIAIASNFPFYGEVISRALGNPPYGSVGDLTEMIPAAGMVRDMALTAKRVLETGDVGYAGSDFIRRWFPPAAPVLRFLPELGGDVQARNASRALTAVAPREMDLVRDRSQGGVYRQTPATVAMRSLISAAYRGDAEGVQENFDKAVAERTEMGSADPAQATVQSLAAQTPSRKVFGRLITPAEENRLIGRMSNSQRADYEASRAAFDLINRTLGTSVSLVKEPEVPRVATRRTGRTRSTRSRLPSLRRGSSRRRSPFGVSRLGARRRRRVPSFSFAS